MDWTFTIGSLTFGLFDVILLAVALISGICGFAKGFSRSMFKLAGYVLTFPAALLFVLPLKNFLSSKMDVPVFWLSLISYIILCLVIFSLFKLLGNLLGTSLETISLGWLDSILGFIVAFLAAAFILFIILELSSLQNVYSLLPLKENSLFYTHIFSRVFPSIKSTVEGALSGI